MKTRTEIRTLQELKTLNGKFDARCHVCWNAVYTLWVDESDPCGKCPFGHIRPDQCPDAIARAQDSASLVKLRQQGFVK